ncbi:hypothetical protein [Paludisphaera borealis]|uniref:hypothetical protein n=1 Tax=Paludisphaera borealis TaxID=1387353 RepID=UPI00097135E0|nr:hypothetical protein [Paludisphaera borealis]
MQAASSQHAPDFAVDAVQQAAAQQPSHVSVLFASHLQAEHAQASPQQAQATLAFDNVSEALTKTLVNPTRANAANIPIIPRRFIMHLLF